MRKYVAILALIFSLAIYVYIQDQRSATNSARQGAPPTDTISAADAHSNHPQRDTEHSGWNPPRWHKLFTWPEGITTWAIILTLMAIAEQTKQTARAANISERAVIASLRPRLEVKHVFLVPDKTITGRPEDGNEWKIGCVLANVGGSKASITQSNLTISRLGVGSIDGLLPAMPPYGDKYSFGQSATESGERREQIIKLGANEEGMDMRVSYYAAQQRGKPIDTTPIVCFGFFRYKDDSGVSRLTGFGWSWNSYDMSFTRLKNPNYEYQD
jgi:hypothetical protein